MGNEGDIDTVDEKVSSGTYKLIDTDRYQKTNPIRAELAGQPGLVKTKEGDSHYEAGADWIKMGKLMVIYSFREHHFG